MVTSCTARLKHTQELYALNHSVFLCFVWISENKTIISQKSISWFLTYTKIYSTVRTEYFRSQFNPNAKISYFGSVCFLPTSDYLDCRSEHLVVFEDKLSLGQVPLRVLRFYRVRFILLLLNNRLNVLLLIPHHQKMKACKPFTNSVLLETGGFRY